MTLTTGRWCWLRFREPAIPHACPVSLVRTVAADLIARGARLLHVERCYHLELSLPGLAPGPQAWDGFVIDGLALDLATAQLITFGHLLAGVTERGSQPGVY